MNDVELDIKKEAAGPTEERQLKELQHLYDIIPLDLVLLPMSMLLFLSDIISDVYLAVQFLLARQWLYGGLTFTLISLPPLFLTFQDYIVNFEAPWRRFSDKWYNWFWLPFYVLFNLEVPVLFIRNWRRALRYLERNKWPFYRTPDTYILTIPEKIQLLDKYQDTFTWISVIIIWEVTLESVPQLVLQLYIIAQEKIAKWYQWASVFTSLAGYAAMKYTARKAIDIGRKERISMKGCIMFTIGRIIPLGCRTIALAFAMSAHPWFWIGPPLTCHYLLTVIWYWYVLPEYGHGRNVARAALEAFAWLIEPMQDNSVHRALLYGLFYFTEDVCLLILWATAKKSFHIIVITIFLAIADLIGRTILGYYSLFFKRFFVIFQESDSKS